MKVGTKVAGICLLTAALLTAESGSIGFGVKDAEINRGLAESVLHGNLPVYPNAKLYHAATTAAQVTFVKASLAAARAYSQTAAFKADYAKRRTDAKPELPASSEAQMTAQQAEQRKKLKETKAEVAKMPADTQKQMKDMLKQMEEQMDKQANDPEMKEQMKQIYQAQDQANQDAYKTHMEEWTANFPEDPNMAIAKRLKDFLDLTADIDFDAKLEAAGGGRMRFADSQLESKSSEWKICYRAGKEPVAAARASVEEWLQQLGGK